MIRTSVTKEAYQSHQVVPIDKSLALVARAFRSIKTISLKIRPVYCYNERHVRGHVFLCMLAYFLEWNLRKTLAPLLFTDHDQEKANFHRETPIGKAQRSEKAEKKQDTKRTDDGF